MHRKVALVAKKPRERRRVALLKSGEMKGIGVSDNEQARTAVPS